MEDATCRLTAESWDELNDEVDELDSDERDDQTADAVDPQVPAQHRRGRRWPVPNAPQGERYQGDDDQRVEDDRRGDRGLGAVQVHDVQLLQPREDAREHRWDDREVLRYVVGDGECGQRPACDQQLLADLNDL